MALKESCVRALPTCIRGTQEVVRLPVMSSEAGLCGILHQRRQCASLYRAHAKLALDGLRCTKRGEWECTTESEWSTPERVADMKTLGL